MMRLGFYAIVLLIVGIVGGFIYLCKVGWTEYTMKKAYNKAIKAEEAHQGKVWEEHSAIGCLVTMYMNMVTKHGPDSEEARAFKFGSDNKMTADLLKDKPIRDAFEQQCDIIDATWLKMQRC